MKQLNTGKAEALFVKVPEDAHEFVLGNHCLGFKSDMEWTRRDSNNWCIVKLGLFGGKDFHKKDRYKILGNPFDLTENVCDGLVAWNDDEQYYKMYPHEKWMGDITAKESWQSFLKANEIYAVNPFESEMKGMTFSNECQNEWQQAEENTGNWIVLIKK